MVIESVAAKPTGVTPITEAAKSASAKDGIPAGEPVSSDKETYTRKELEAIVHQVSSEAGRTRAAIEKERDTFKSQAEKLTTELTGNQTEIDSLQTKIDGLSSDDPEKYEAAKEMKALREERKTLKADRDTFETEKKSHSERLTLAETTLREIALFEIAREYEGGDPEKLKDLCETFKAASDEQYRKGAEKLWLKKGTIPNEPLKLDGGSSGGALTDAQIVQNYITDPYNPVNKQRYFEYRAKQRKY